MARKPPREKRPAHRPEKVIDWDVVDSYLEAQVSGVKIAAKLRICHDTLYRRCEDEKGVTFSVYSQSRKDSGQADLMKAQMELALEKDRGMLIHLGEHVLDQGKQKEVAPPNEDATATRHALMMALAQIDKLTAELNAHKPQTKQELCGSDTPL
jgi:hypothetical protein